MYGSCSICLWIYQKYNRFFLCVFKKQLTYHLYLPLHAPCPLLSFFLLTCLPFPCYMADCSVKVGITLLLIDRRRKVSKTFSVLIWSHNIHTFYNPRFRNKATERNLLGHRVQRVVWSRQHWEETVLYPFPEFGKCIFSESFIWCFHMHMKYYMAVFVTIVKVGRKIWFTPYF